MAALATALPQRVRMLLLRLLCEEPGLHLEAAPELHRGRGYKNATSMLVSNRKRGLRGIEAAGETMHLGAVSVALAEIQ